VNLIGLYIFGAGVSYGKLLKFLSAFPKVVLEKHSSECVGFPVLIELGSL